jgi:hypothetical protein
MRTALKSWSLKGSLRQVQEIPIHSSHYITWFFTKYNHVQPITIQQSIQQAIFPTDVVTPWLQGEEAKSRGGSAATPRRGRMVATVDATVDGDSSR